MTKTFRLFPEWALYILAFSAGVSLCTALMTHLVWLICFSATMVAVSVWAYVRAVRINRTIYRLQGHRVGKRSDCSETWYY